MFLELNHEMRAGKKAFTAALSLFQLKTKPGNAVDAMSVLQWYITIGCLCVSVSVVCAEQKPEQIHSDSENWSFITEVRSAQGVFQSLRVTLADCINCGKWI